MSHMMPFTIIAFSKEPLDTILARECCVADLVRVQSVDHVGRLAVRPQPAPRPEVVLPQEPPARGALEPTGAPRLRFGLVDSVWLYAG